MANENELHLKVVTPQGKIVDAQVVSATFPIADGEVTILPRHTDYIASLGAGELRYTLATGEKKSLTFKGGFCECKKNELAILPDTLG